MSSDLKASLKFATDLHEALARVQMRAPPVYDYPRRRPSEDDPPIFACGDCGLVEVFEKGALCAECDPNPPEEE